MPVDQVPNHYTQEYNSNWITRVQQTKSRLEPWIESLSFSGERKRFDRVQGSKSRRRTERVAPTPVSNAVSDNRWAYREFFEIPARMLDKDDALNLGVLTLPTSRYVMDDASEYNRVIDDLACDVALRAALTGELGTTTDALPAAQKIVNGGTGMTKAKLMSSLGIRKASEVDEGGNNWVLVIGTQQWIDIMNLAEVQSFDYNSAKPLVTGEVTQWLGYTFVTNNRLPKTGNVRSCVAWAKGAIQLIKGDMVTDISVRKDLSLATQIYSMFNLGGVRIHDEAVIQIDCVEP